MMTQGQMIQIVKSVMGRVVRATVLGKPDIVHEAIRRLREIDAPDDDVSAKKNRLLSDMEKWVEAAERVRDRGEKIHHELFPGAVVVIDLIGDSELENIHPRTVGQRIAARLREYRFMPGEIADDFASIETKSELDRHWTNLRILLEQSDVPLV